MKLSVRSPGESGYALSNWVLILVTALALAGIGITAMTSVVAKSRLVATKEQLRALEKGFVAYHDERHSYPLGIDNEDVQLIGIDIAGVLLGEKSDQNPDGRRYWDAEAISPGTAAKVPTDPFGGLYWVAFDADGDGRVRNPVHKEDEWLEISVLVFSAGPDGDPTTWNDNVRNWK